MNSVAKTKAKVSLVKTWVTIGLIQVNRTMLNVVMSNYVHHFVWNNIKKQNCNLVANTVTKVCPR